VGALTAGGRARASRGPEERSLSSWRYQLDLAGVHEYLLSRFDRRWNVGIHYILGGTSPLFTQLRRSRGTGCCCWARDLAYMHVSPEQWNHLKSLARSWLCATAVLVSFQRFSICQLSAVMLKYLPSVIIKDTSSFSKR
jgi:hypothetical protein